MKALCPYSCYDCVLEGKINCVECYVEDEAMRRIGELECQESCKTYKPYSKQCHGKSTKRSRREKHQQKLERLVKYGYHAVIRRKEWDDPESRIIRRSYSYGSGRVGFFKNYSNKQVRRHKGGVGNGGWYKKVFDLWWTID